MKRPTLDEYYIEIAKVVSLRSTCLRKHLGCVIVNNGEIISTGYNNPPRSESHCLECTKCNNGKDTAAYLSCPAVHAEQNAIISAARKDMIGATLYLGGYNVKSGEAIECDAWPCEICLRLIKNAGIARVVNNKGTIYMRSDDGILRQIREKETK